MLIHGIIGFLATLLLGQEITPFLNDLIKESYYFDEFYHQTGQGKTSDAEFIMDNSLYPLPSGVYFTHTTNEYNATLKVFFDEMKQSGLYENSIFILYGDHYGISPNHNDAMAKFLGKEITAYEQTQLQRVPLIIHIPGVTGGTISKVTGQIDVRPTLLHLTVETDEEMIQ